MIRRQVLDGGAQVKVSLVLPADPDRSDAVSVAGDFNDWDPAATRLRRRGKTRSVSVVLAAGQRYAFRYVGGDGEWFNDDAVDDYEPNGLGDTNGIIDLRDSR